MCTKCGCLGHNLYQCQNKNPISTKTEDNSTSDTANKQWKMISYAPKRYTTTTHYAQKLEKKTIEKGKNETEKKEEKE